MLRGMGLECLGEASFALTISHATMCISTHNPVAVTCLPWVLREHEERLRSPPRGLVIGSKLCYQGECMRAS